MKWYDVCNRISLLLHALFSAAGYFLIEAICRHSLSEAWVYMTEKPLVFAYNAAFIFTTTLIVYLFRRRCFLRVLLAMFWLLLGIINGVILANRVTPFTGPDLALLTDGMALLEKYLPAWGVTVALIVLGIFALILLILLIKGPRYKGKLKYRYNLPLVLAGVAAFGGITQLALEKRVLSNYFGNIAFAYEDYGYPYCLATTIFNTGISCPRDYSEKEIARIEETESDLPETDTEDLPNIVFVQLESFFDPELVNYLDISDDPIPNFRKLMEEYTSGYYKVPSVGAGTANTEFESITGMSMHYFGPGEYPYKSILKETTCESAPYVLKELGYSTMPYITMRQTSTAERVFSRILDLTPSLRRNICRRRMTKTLLDGPGTASLRMRSSSVWIPQRISRIMYTPSPCRDTGPTRKNRSSKILRSQLPARPQRRRIISGNTMSTRSMRWTSL